MQTTSLLLLTLGAVLGLLPYIEQDFDAYDPMDNAGLMGPQELWAWATPTLTSGTSGVGSTSGATSSTTSGATSSTTSGATSSTTSSTSSRATSSTSSRATSSILSSILSSTTLSTAFSTTSRTRTISSSSTILSPTDTGNSLSITTAIILEDGSTATITYLTTGGTGTATEPTTEPTAVTTISTSGAAYEVVATSFTGASDGRVTTLRVRRPVGGQTSTRTSRVTVTTTTVTRTTGGMDGETENDDLYPVTVPSPLTTIRRTLCTCYPLLCVNAGIRYDD